MDNFDKMLKEKASLENISLPDELNNKIDEVIKELPDKQIKRKTPAMKALIAAALIAVVSLTAVYAKDIPIVSSIVDFFKGDSNEQYSSDAKTYEKLSSMVGQTVLDNGVSVTIDNVACDDNFLVLFYTIQGDGEKVFKGEGGVPIVSNIIGKININGKPKSSSNNDKWDSAYLTDDDKVRGMIRADISKDTLSDYFNVDFLVSRALGKEGQWNFKFDVSKEAASKDTKNYQINKTSAIKYPDGREHNITVDKVSLTPFGNQLTISEKYKTKVSKYDKELPPIFNLFALFDDKGNQLDILNKQIFSGADGASNSFEFVKCSKNVKSLTIVPVYTYSDNAPKEISNIPMVSLDKLPLELKMSNNGSLIIDKVSYGDNDTRIYYTKKGTILYNPNFTIIDEAGRNAFENTSVLYQNYIVDRDKGVYVYILPKLDSSKNYKVKYLADEKFKLLYDQKIEIKLN